MASTQVNLDVYGQTYKLTGGLRTEPSGSASGLQRQIPYGQNSAVMWRSSSLKNRNFKFVNLLKVDNKSRVKFLRCLQEGGGIAPLQLVPRNSQ